MRRWHQLDPRARLVLGDHPARWRAANGGAAVSIVGALHAGVGREVYMSELDAALVGGIIGAIVGGMVATVGSMLANQWQMKRDTRLRMLQVAGNLSSTIRVASADPERLHEIQEDVFELFRLSFVVGDREEELAQRLLQQFIDEVNNQQDETDFATRVVNACRQSADELLEQLLKGTKVAGYSNRA